MFEQIKHIHEKNRLLVEYINQVSEPDLLVKKNIDLVKVVSKIIVGQMLSRQAADTIFGRIEYLFDEPSHLAKCEESDLTKHGVSKNKAKAILNFARMYSEDMTRFNNWPSLSFDELKRESKDIWGVSDWSLSILALFHFGHEDVFPENDGTLKRAISRLEELGVGVEPDLSVPYRSYLALYLWKLIDDKVI
ncbi:DNA-3-methyladenine glycosylase family protein [Vibrio coralliirubri]|uniref:DNA-3-methyladenine glycosylase family protein n=1 Tax=Vibrio coralliirubri TaxID=1516159 RepID=UPI000637DAE1|nr:hypothetical protein [Vibrio coralliirubri]CDT47961.1 3-methyladenine DNA glycosylase [Vibrio coralliirubri]